MSVHNAAKKGAIAPTVLLPGDPLRAKFIAENFLTDVTCYNEVRNMLGFTGLHKGARVSVQGTGMGMPSISIYAQELMEHYDVENLIRIGTCGTFLDEVQIRDVVLAMGASTDSGMNRMRFQGLDFAPVADFNLLKKAYDYGEKNGFPLKVGNVLSSDFFYNEPLLGDVYEIWKGYGILAVEMEAAALYTLAARFRRKALSIMTVTDHLTRKEHISPEDRQTSLIHMIEMALSLV